MFSPEDTIAALATPPGRGGLGVVRISGPGARTVAERLIQTNAPLAPRHATLATIAASNSSRPIDQVVVTLFPAPHSYTGEEVVEISAHGSPVILREIVSAALTAGARLAEPGEFTFRAFLNGRIDLVQAEAVADLIDAVTPVQARAAFDQLQGTLTAAIGAIDRDLFDLAARLEASIDFPDEGFHFVEPAEARATLARVTIAIDALLAHAARGRIIREGLQIAIVGKPNVGKSTLFNQLLGGDRAIVSETPGTTRDLVTEDASIGGVRVTLVDTAGVRDAVDSVEAEGVRRAQRAVDVAALSIVVLDRSRPLDADDAAVIEVTRGKRRVIVVNKIDLPAVWTRDRFKSDACVEVSLTAGPDTSAVGDAIQRAIDRESWSAETPAITNVRHIALVDRAREALTRAVEAIDAGAQSEELILFEIADARMALEEVSGRRAPEDVLRHIFERFCIGK
jgi:tRNA modification GTPase